MASWTHELHAEKRQAARAHALTKSRDSVFEGVYARYEALLPQAVRLHK
jgi:hypothetical protein